MIADKLANLNGQLLRRSVIANASHPNREEDRTSLLLAGRIAGELTALELAKDGRVAFIQEDGFLAIGGGAQHARAVVTFE